MACDAFARAVEDPSTLQPRVDAYFDRSDACEGGVSAAFADIDSEAVARTVRALARTPGSGEESSLAPSLRRDRHYLARCVLGYSTAAVGGLRVAGLSASPGSQGRPPTSVFADVRRAALGALASVEQSEDDAFSGLLRRTPPTAKAAAAQDVTCHPRTTSLTGPLGNVQTSFLHALRVVAVAAQSAAPTLFQEVRWRGSALRRTRHLCP